MRRTEILGKPISINNRDHRQLVKRFDVNGIEWDRDEEGEGIIWRSCICEHYDHCRRCPFDKFQDFSSLGCVNVLDSILGGEPSGIILTPGSIEVWSKKGKKDVQKVQNWLLNMEVK